MGMYKIRTEDGSAVDTGEFISFTSYHSKWKRDYPNLKVSTKTSLKKKKYDRMKEQLDKVAFGDDNDEADGAAM